MGQGKYKANPEHLLVPESAQNTKGWGGMAKEHRSQPERALNGQSSNILNKINVIFDYNPQYKVNIHESILV